MKKIFTFIILSIAIVVPTFAQQENEDEKDNSDPQPVGLEIDKKFEDSPGGPHRTSSLIDIDVLFTPNKHTIEVCSYRENSGEVFLYLNDSLIDYSPDLNTTFQLTTPGLYKIVIIEESWIATGYITY